MKDFQLFSLNLKKHSSLVIKEGLSNLYPYQSNHKVCGLDFTPVQPHRIDGTHWLQGSNGFCLRASIWALISDQPTITAPQGKISFSPHTCPARSFFKQCSHLISC